MLTIQDRIKPSFGGHEKFAFRDGWLKKGVDAVCEDPLIFSSDDALVVLGVGKNMVRSIRHWCLATNLFVEGEGRKSPLSLTPMGNQLMTDNAWDPFLEDTASLWLLHWQLVSNTTRSFVWHLVFNHFYEAEFSKQSLAAFIQTQLERYSVSTTSRMIEREVDCFLRTYTVSVNTSRSAEERLDCPLSELDLIRAVPQDNVYRLNTGPKATLPVEVFGYGLLTYLRSVAQHRRTVVVDECTYRPGSPGQIFRLDENSVIEYVESLSVLTKGKLQLQESVGIQQIYIDIDVDQPALFERIADSLLESYYA
ncbi:DUF4007 family protein [Candidatus Saccharibacteria bacterium]|nr:DUF4007 family protein [Candidatus Saccharibacteria bacterium]